MVEIDTENTFARTFLQLFLEHLDWLVCLGDKERCQMSQPFNIVDVLHLRLFLHDDGVESSLPADYQTVSVERRRARIVQTRAKQDKEEQVKFGNSVQT